MDASSGWREVSGTVLLVLLLLMLCCCSCGVLCDALIRSLS